MPVPKSLQNDHALIAAALDALSKFVEQIEAEGSVDRGVLRSFADFFEGFVGELHAQKEEQVVVPRLVRAGAEWLEGPLAEIRQERGKEQYLVRVMRQLSAREPAFEADHVRQLLSELRAFLVTTRTHLELKESSLFPMIELLASAQQDELRDAVNDFDNSPLSAKQLPRLRKLAEELIERFQGDAECEPNREP